MVLLDGGLVRGRRVQGRALVALGGAPAEREGRTPRAEGRLRVGRPLGSWRFWQPLDARRGSWKRWAASRREIRWKVDASTRAEE